jgi:predicted transcriptional regulator
MPDSDYSHPEPSGISKEMVERMAALVAAELGYQPGVPWGDVIEALGGKITYQTIWEMEDSTSGSIRIADEGDFEIFLAAHTGAERDRFTIAHELGHYFLHFLFPRQLGRKVGSLRATRYGSGRVEWEANWFAAGFLMPEAEFRRAYTETSRDLFALSEHFGVSKKAVEVRAKSLKLE